MDQKADQERKAIRKLSFIEYGGFPTVRKGNQNRANHRAGTHLSGGAGRKRNSSRWRVLKTMPLETEVKIEGLFGNLRLHNDVKRDPIGRIQ